MDKYRYYYNAAWQILEERETASENTAPDSVYALYQYVWSQRYIDAPILRDENIDGDDDCTESGVDERLYYTTDAKMNSTSLPLIRFRGDL